MNVKLSHYSSKITRHTKHRGTLVYDCFLFSF